MVSIRLNIKISTEYMKIIYCSSSENIQELKTVCSDYTSSKISTLFTNPEPIFVKEFLSIKNLEVIKVKDYPDYYNLWNDMMNKITFAYNYRHLESKIIFDEYREFNKKYAEEINKICGKNDLLIINNASLYLLPGMVNCKVAIRNIDFDECFIERVPYYKEVLLELFKAQKFFSSKAARDSFINYITCSYNFLDHDIGGCHFIESYVDKHAVLDILKLWTAYMESKRSESTIIKNELINHLERIHMPKEYEVILTNVPLLHLEAYIKKNKKVNIRYIRASVEIDEKQERMIQYLKKAYGCQIDVIDKHDYNIIVSEMLYCDIFIGSKHNMLAALFLVPTIYDEVDPCMMKKKIEKMLSIDEIKKEELYEKQKKVLGEEEFLEIFLKYNNCWIEIEANKYSVDEKILQYIDGLRACMKNDFSYISNLMPPHNNRFKNETDTDISETHDENEIIVYKDKEMQKDHILYEKYENDKKILFKRRSSSGLQKTVNPNEYIGVKNNTITVKHIRNNTKNIKIPEMADFAKIKEFWNNSEKVALLDYDGTLAEIKETPDLAKPTEELIDFLHEFSKHARLIICTGRSVDIADKWFPKSIEIYAEHGCAHRQNGKWIFKDKINGIEDCIEIMNYYQIRTPGSIVEVKSCGCAFHYKRVKDFDLEKLYFLLKKTVGNAVVLGKGVIEVTSSNKYEVVMNTHPTIVAGDDNVDEDMFEGCDGISIRVGKGKTKADYYVESVPNMLYILKGLIK